MADSRRRLILGNGEQYIQPVKKPATGRSPEPPRSYEEARQVVKQGVQNALRTFEALPEAKRFADEAVFCLRLHPEATAKSYDPVALFDEVPELRKVGSRKYRERAENVAQTARLEKQSLDKDALLDARLVFVQSTPAGFERLITQLDRAESRVPRQVRDEIRRVERFDTLDTGEQLVGFGEKWKSGRAELVLHPSRIAQERQLQFLFDLFEETGVETDSSQVRPYPGGPTFVSCKLTRSALRALAGVNPLRAAHPLHFGGFKDLRTAPTAKAPKPPSSPTRSTIKIGMFDGGIDPTAPLLQGHVEEDTSLEISTPSKPEYVAHGTAVAGALLHGELNGKAADKHLPPPPVFVVSIRALPTSSRTDIDLYESIDVVERAVPARNDIKVFNLSFGPDGPIQDDTISRFTYVLDTLAVTHKVSFFVAVGNTGDVVGFERVQAPADLVHGIGVGAFTMQGDAPVHAPYSCRGPGRECGKIKPDLAAFGGCENTPIHLVSTSPGLKLLDWGTSFASPLAARLGGQASEIFERSSALLSRALLVHTSLHPNLKPDHLLGHGCVLPDIDEVLLCEEQSTTVVFNGAILPTGIVRLPIPWPSGIVIPGKVQITWTVAALSPIDPNHPGDYTSCCLEDTFYPNGKRFTFSPPQGTSGTPKRLHLVSDKAEIAKLLAQSWKQSSFPVTESGNDYRDEDERRKLDCKWEPIVRRYVSKQAKGLDDPFLTLHAIGRNDARDRFDYAVVVTLRAEKFGGDLYGEIRKRYPALSPIRLRTEAEIRVQI
ncbi:MAG TPA: S8 family peptidase [Pirellulales bacterium]|jgi:hypothetical protein